MTQTPAEPGLGVANALLEDPRTEDAIIDVANDRGIITLTGTVASEEIRQAAEDIARDNQGVITVVNELKVE
ncbi:MAG TPA: BON domain-containing protein [Anaerolineales bacterium]|jgi:osmotically-inducible protein OsmY|nr:BON domain-containing protein [Anaerolineales bacterium]